MPKLKEITVTYEREESTRPYCNATVRKTVVVQPLPDEPDGVASLKAMAYCRNHVLAELSSIFPALRKRLDGLPLDLDGQLGIQVFNNLPEEVQQAMVENGIDPDRFIYFMLPENVEAELKGD